MGINDRDLHGWREQIVLTPALPLVPLVAQRFSHLDKLTNVLPFAAFCGAAHVLWGLRAKPLQRGGRTQLEPPENARNIALTVVFQHHIFQPPNEKAGTGFDGEDRGAKAHQIAEQIRQHGVKRPAARVKGGIHRRLNRLCPLGVVGSPNETTAWPGWSGR